ncbi:MULTISPECIES: DUF421 domain-containing protein [Ruminococcus]|uniref:Uncharacterized membrane protein YcaP, DUF421 family n=1 Tax=Ruminococcus flavefaciens TaxID=1265 RepID=A0A1M7J186_RUMFL|nr:MULTISPECIES: DUF421 domain-containing protein [Ruminococcus]MCR4795977.1 DUF421 domain-containing protein [Ruminococcus sp.]SHM46751.1 Uncharacterized membrane protein YcaP, DUF421 family [Ruminococcus flavefaciens]
MCVVLIRSLLLYILVIFAVRLMGKRQLGELQPSELVITILVSNIATLPIEDVNIPVIVGVTPILALVCFEVIVSCINLKFPKVRRLISGSPKIVVRGGCIERDILRELRFSVDDLLMALRSKDIFDLSEVQYAIVETTGSISVMKKASEDTPTRRDMKIAADCSDPPVLIISDGSFIPKAMESMKLSRCTVETVLKKHDISVENVFIMTADSSGNCFVADKQGSPPKKLRIGEENDES